MAFDSKKTILLEKTYLYVRASLGFQLEGTSTEKIPTNNGFYRFFVNNLQKAIGNSYVNILYDSQDLTLQCFCSDLYMDELMSSDSSAIEDVVAELKKNTTTIIEFENGVSSALAANHEDNVLLHADNESINGNLSSLLSVLDSKDSFYSFNQYYSIDSSNGRVKPLLSFLLSYHDFVYEPLYDSYVYRLNECVYQKYSSDKFSLNFRLKYLYGKESINSNVRCSSRFTYYRPSLGRYFTSNNNATFGTMGDLLFSPMYESNDILVHSDIVIQISKESYNYMVFCDNSFSNNYSFYERSNFGDGKDSIFLYVEPNTTTCTFSHKLDIKKHFDTEKTYDLVVYVPTSLSTDYLTTNPKFYVFVNGSEISFPATVYTKLEGGKQYYTYSMSFTGSKSYRISSISFNSIWDS